MLAGYGALVGVVRPRGQHEQLTGGAGFKIGARRFVIFWKAVFQYDNERKLGIKGSLGYLFFSWTDAR